MKITKALKNMICSYDKAKKFFTVSYIRIFTDNTFVEDVSKYTKQQSNDILNFAKSMNETNDDRNKLFKLENVIFDTQSKLNLDLRKISVKYKDATCKNSYSDITHKAFARFFADNDITSLFFADSQTAIKSVIKENRVNETEKKFSVYAIENLLITKKQKAKSKKSKVKKQVKAKSKKQVKAKSKKQKVKS